MTTKPAHSHGPMEDDAWRWEVLARLTEGGGTFSDFQNFAKDFCDNHLSPEAIHLSTRIWLNGVLKGVLSGKSPPKVFGASKARGAKKNIENKCAITAYVRLRERWNYDKPILDAAEFFGLDESNIRKNLIDGWGQSFSDEVLQMLATTSGNPGDKTKK